MILALGTIGITSVLLVGTIGSSTLYFKLAHATANEDPNEHSAKRVAPATVAKGSDPPGRLGSAVSDLAPGHSDDPNSAAPGYAKRAPIPPPT